jgi:hypothetical protein
MVTDDHEGIGCQPIGINLWRDVITEFFAELLTHPLGRRIAITPGDSVKPIHPHHAKRKRTLLAAQLADKLLGVAAARQAIERLGADQAAYSLDTGLAVSRVSCMPAKASLATASWLVTVFLSLLTLSERALRKTEMSPILPISSSVCTVWPRFA